MMKNYSCRLICKECNKILGTSNENLTDALCSDCHNKMIQEMKAKGEFNENNN